MSSDNVKSGRRRFIQYGGTALVAVVSGCSAGGISSEPATQAAAGQSWDPVRLEVEPGTEVTWKNEGSFQHTVTSAKFHDKATEWEFDENLTSSESVTYTFEESGIYEHHSTARGDGKDTMCGAVLVGDVTLDAKLPCE